jgi:hypothetical protein
MTLHRLDPGSPAKVFAIANQQRATAVTRVTRPNPGDGHTHAIQVHRLLGNDPRSPAPVDDERWADRPAHSPWWGDDGPIAYAQTN